MKKKSKNRPLRFYFRDEKGRHEITLSRKCLAIEAEFRDLLQFLADSKNYGTRLSVQTLRRVENLPLEPREKLVASGLIEATPAEKAAKIPTLSVFLDRYKITRVGVKPWSVQRDKKLFNYLLEYLGPNKRIDKITREEAEGIRKYLMQDRKAGKGRLAESSTNKVISEIKSIFRYAVDWELIAQSPFEKVKGGKTTNPERQYYVSRQEIEAAMEACTGHPELAKLLAFGRFAGLRIPSEIHELKFSDFETHGDGGIFTVRQGKTGRRRIPVFDDLRPYFEALQAAAKPGQVYVFEKYRNCRNPAVLIKDYMVKAGLVPWEKFFTNLRSSCQTDKEREGYSRSEMDAIFGNSEKIRQQHYIQPLPDVEYAALGRSRDGRNEHLGSNQKVSVKVSDENGFLACFGETIPTFDECLAEVLNHVEMPPKEKSEFFESLTKSEIAANAYGRGSAFLKTLSDREFYSKPEPEQMRFVLGFARQAFENCEKIAGQMESTQPAEIVSSGEDRI